MRRPLMVLTLAAVTVAAAPVAAGAATLHVRSGAPARGTGSAAQPFGTLTALAAASGPGDVLVVDPSTGPALDGGIALKPGQTLRGGGPAVVGAAAGSALPVLTNTKAATLDGDAIRLADGATVENVVVRGAARGAIYGLDTTGVTITGNDVSGHNTSCTYGFLVQPFTAPTGVPFVGGGVPPKIGLAPQNGWAGIMVDGRSASGAIAIAGNLVHDAQCGDGIDIRAAGTSRLTATVDRNVVRGLAQGATLAPVGSVLAIGMQARDHARLDVTQSGNTQTDIGSVNADCEGQFANVSESGVLTDRVTRNTFRRGIGGFSCNGFESIISNGDGTLDTVLTDSTFEDNEGDMFEEGNLGAGSTMHWDMRRVVARRTRQRGANGPTAGDPGAGAIPFNLGDCMVLGHNGAGNTTVFHMSDTVLEDCNNGIAALSAPALGNGSGPAGSLIVDVAHSRIAGNAKYGIEFLNDGPSRALALKVASTEVTGNGGYGVGIEQPATGSTQRADLDLGGGSLGSAGGNCLVGNGKADLAATGLKVHAQRAWWGRAGGPGARQVATSAGGSANTAAPLAARPDCGPRPAAAPLTLAVGRQRLATALGRGLLVRARCGDACSVTLAVALTRARDVARGRFASRRLTTVTRRLAAGRALRTRIALPRRLRGVGPTTLLVTATVTPADGPPVVVRRRVALV